jgi:hypothetical protein
VPIGRHLTRWLGRLIIVVVRAINLLLREFFARFAVMHDRQTITARPFWEQSRTSAANERTLDEAAR